MVEDEAEAELRRLKLPRATLRGAEPGLLPPREPEVVAALGVEASARRLQPRFARCCKTRRRRSSLRGTGLSGRLTRVITTVLLCAFG